MGGEKFSLRRFGQTHLSPASHRDTFDQQHQFLPAWCTAHSMPFHMSVWTGQLSGNSNMLKQFKTSTKR